MHRRKTIRSSRRIHSTLTPTNSQRIAAPPVALVFRQTQHSFTHIPNFHSLTHSPTHHPPINAHIACLSQIYLKDLPLVVSALALEPGPPPGTPGSTATLEPKRVAFIVWIVMNLISQCVLFWAASWTKNRLTAMFKMVMAFPLEAEVLERLIAFKKRAIAAQDAQRRAVIVVMVFALALRLPWW